MTGTERSDVAAKLAELHLSFKQQLPGKIADIETHWKLLQVADDYQSELVELHRITHSLAGSGGTFGAVVVSAIAKDIEKIFKSLQNELNAPRSISIETKKLIDELLVGLKEAEEKWQPSVSSYDASVGQQKTTNKGGVIYLVEDDELLAIDLTTKLEYANYAVQHFAELADFEKAIEIKMPTLIIMDVVFKEGDVAGADTIYRLKQKYDPYPPVVFISIRDDMEARLSAARAGARRYFRKPLNMNTFIPVLDGLTERVVPKPFNVLIIDDDETLLEYYATVLSDAGMVVKTLSQPLQILNVLAEFTPDVIISDVHMPECLGTELAQVIRQDDAWAMTPIMFLSTESDINRQLAAMDLGGDDFLVKPIEPGHLISAVFSRAKRARWIKQINSDLNNAIRENKD